VGNLLTSFTFDRNTFKRSPELSADSVAEHIDLVRKSSSLDKTASNIVGAPYSHMGLFRKDEAGQFHSTDLADSFLRLYRQDKKDSWRWLITRSLWRFSTPNGTQAKANAVAVSLNAAFNFFQVVVRILSFLQGEPGERRFLYYEEFCQMMNDDKAWTRTPLQLFQDLQTARSGGFPKLGSRKGFLVDLEPSYSIPRDNMNGLFQKGFEQTGLFEFIQNGVKPVGIALSSRLDAVLQNRARFILDHPVVWDPKAGAWQTFLELTSEDLPEEVSLSDSPTAPEPVYPPSERLDNLVADFHEALAASNFVASIDLVHRFIASLLTKNLVILTGLSGSGKTKLAICLASWLTQFQVARAPLQEGAKIPGDKVTYIVLSSDRLSVELRNSDEDTKVVLPRGLISEWSVAIVENHFDRATSPRDIRDIVAKTTKYSLQLNSFESPLKAAAFALVESDSVSIPTPAYAVVPVGADWTSSDNILGYADALDKERYVRRQALDVILAADADPTRPYVLILDEMNLSHVERYFSDILSAMESGEHIQLHTDRAEGGSPAAREGVPSTVQIPRNLFIVGTVNVDETTYMFSPKVLDRANVVEFRPTAEELSGFLQEPRTIDMTALAGRGAKYASSFARAARLVPDLGKSEAQKVRGELSLLLDRLSAHGFGFGFRTAYEISKFVAHHKAIAPSSWSLEKSIDAQIVQKLMPKLNGSRAKLEPILCAIATLCYYPRDWNEGADPVELRNRPDLVRQANAAAELNEQDHPLLAKNEDGSRRFDPTKSLYPLSFDKASRMLQQLEDQGFASFAEA
jgi:hypothetical protein